jgi:hypothetical protein
MKSNRALYWFMAGLLDACYWGGELIGYDNLPEKGPAVFVVNHLGPLGPIGAACSIPRRMHAWIVADMVDPHLAAEYLRWDFVERTLKLKPSTSTAVARLLSRVTVPLLRTLGCIPVYRGYENMHKTWEICIPLLLEEKYMLVFPEEISLPMDPVTQMRPFQKSVFRLGEMYFEKTHQRLGFYPVAVHGSHKVKIGEPVFHNPFTAAGLERHRLKDIMEDSVRRLYLELEHGDFTAALTPERK